MSAKYKIVCDSIQQDIEGEKYTQAGKLPTEDELIELYRVSRNTIRKAIDLLVKRGIVMPIQGSGIFLRNAPTEGCVNLENFHGLTAGFSKRRVEAKVIDFKLIDPVTCRLAKEFNLPIRTLPLGWDKSEAFAELASLRRPDVSLVEFYGPGVDEAFFTNFFAAHPQLRDSTVEVMCHPAYLDDFLLGASSYTLPRVRELQVLKSPAVAKWVEENGVELINYREL